MRAALLVATVLLALPLSLCAEEIVGLPKEPGKQGELAGKWRLLLPAGFEYDATLKWDDEHYVLKVDANAFNGRFAVRDKTLAFVGEDRRQWEWKILSPYMLQLGKHDFRNGADYTGAVLFRPTDKLTRYKEEAAKAQPRHSWSVKELEALQQAGRYLDVRQKMAGDELHGTAIVKSNKKWLQVELGEFWSASFFGLHDFSQLKEGDRIEFEGRINDEAYANIAVWVKRWKKLE
jgi:hypothetical protein